MSVITVSRFQLCFAFYPLKVDIAADVGDAKVKAWSKYSNKNQTGQKSEVDADASSAKSNEKVLIVL